MKQILVVLMMVVLVQGASVAPQDMPADPNKPTPPVIPAMVMSPPPTIALEAKIDQDQAREDQASVSLTSAIAALDKIGQQIRYYESQHNTDPARIVNSLAIKQRILGLLAQLPLAQQHLEISREAMKSTAVSSRAVAQEEGRLG